MKPILKFTLLGLALSLLSTVHAGSLPLLSLPNNNSAKKMIAPTTGTLTNGSSYSVCFTPGSNCEGLITEEIRHAKKSILVQAFSFTSLAIASVLAEAKGRGVDVRAILDKSHRTEKYSGATYLKHAGIPVVIDEAPQIAHNKVMIFDGSTVLTGSFNFTKSAQERNAENVLIIRGDQGLSAAYVANWVSRWDVSVPY